MPKGSGQQLIKNIQTQVSDCIKQGGEVIYITEWDIPTIPELME
jgi:nicotinamidase-related amidase